MNAPKVNLEYASRFLQNFRRGMVEKIGIDEAVHRILKLKVPLFVSKAQPSWIATIACRISWELPSARVPAHPVEHRKPGCLCSVVKFIQARIGLSNIGTNVIDG